MAGNQNPIFSRVGAIGWSGLIKDANTNKDGTGVANTVFTADSTNGSWVERIKFQPLGTNIATVARVFINNGGTSTAANNAYWDQITLAATTNSEAASLTVYELPLGFALPPGYTIFVTLGTAVAAGYQAIVIAGNY